VQIRQRGGRRAREAKLLLRSATVELLAPAGMLVITAFLAVRLLQLRERLDAPADTPETTCETVLNADEWKVLWLSTGHNQPIPKTAPSARWAFYAIANLGGFTDTKRTGRPGWDTI
jgi:hypothetical protein